MARQADQVKADWRKNQSDILAYKENNDRDINAARISVRETIISGKEIDKEDQLAVLLKAEYDLEREENEIFFTANWIMLGRDIKAPQFKHELERSLLRAEMQSMDQNKLETAKTEYGQKKANGQKIGKDNVYVNMLNRESQLTSIIESIKEGQAKKQREEQLRQEERERREREEAEKMREEQLRQEERERKAKEEAEKMQKEIAENLYKSAEEPVKPKRGFWGRVRDAFRRKPKEEPVKGTIMDMLQKEKEKEEAKKKSEKTLEDYIKEGMEEDDLSKDIDEDIVEKKELTEEEKKAQEQKQKEEDERQHKYRVEFAGKELPEAIRNCNKPEVLREYLDKASTLSAEAREHLEARVAANEKIKTLEETRAIKNKERPPCVKYNDGTILLKNKKHNMPKQTTLNGSWSCVLSDMLAHFGVELTQEEIRAYRPDINPEMAKSNEAKLMMNRLNKDTMNDIGDMADLIQRTVPNVAHHHMSLATNREDNKAAFKLKVNDVLLNKNSPVALMYNNQYLSIVGIKDNTLIVQNPDPKFNAKYQKLTIDDLFADSKGHVTIDWLEDLKFTKEGACKNANNMQWKNMGITCKDREFTAGKDKNQMTHVRGNEYYDNSRLARGIEETIYMPKMSYGKEKELAERGIKQQTPQLETVLTTPTIQNKQLEQDEFEMRGK